MGSLLDNIDNTLNSGNSYVVKMKLFEIFSSEIIRNFQSYGAYYSLSSESFVKRMINERRYTFEHLTVGDLKNYFYLNELEIRQFCSDGSVVKNVQDTLYSFSVPESSVAKGRVEYYHGKYTCNLDNALYALTGGTFIIEIEDIDCGKYLIDVKSTPECVRDFVLNNVKKCHITLNPDFFEDLKDYCLKKLELR